MSVGSQEENDKILPIIIPQGYMTKSIWIGLQRKNDASGDEYPKDYQWTDGTETDYQHFAGTIFQFKICIVYNSTSNFARTV